MKEFIKYSLILFVFISCGNNSFEKKIAAEIEKNQTQEKCIVNIKNLTDFDWDKMYVFNYSLSNEDIYKILKTKDIALGMNDNIRRIVFMNGNKVALCDEEISEIENYTPNEVIFPIPDSLNYGEYKPTDAIFSASIRKEGEIKYYQLWLYSDSIANKH
jgi:hypothetical protein